MSALTISRRIILMVVAAIIALILVGGVGLYVSDKETQNIKLITEDSLPSIETLGEARQAYMELRVGIYTHLVNTDEVAIAQVEKRIEDASQKLSKTLKDYEKMLSNDEDRKLLDENVRDLKAYMD